jgi:protein-tyrosine phosphatase
MESSIIPYPKHIKIDKVDIIDLPTAPIGIHFNTLTDKIHAHLNANQYNKVLVHCMAGISRSK